MALEINATLTVRWNNIQLDPGPGDAFKDAVEAAIVAEVPQSIRDAWAGLAIATNAEGQVEEPTATALVSDQIDALNAARETGHPQFAVAGSTFTGCHYVWVNCNRVCYYNYAVTLGGDTWTVDDPAGRGPPAELDLEISWSLKI